jgi:MutS domain V
MRAGLLFADRDVDPADLPPAWPDLMPDLELERLYAAMAAGDAEILAVVRRVVPTGLAIAEEVRHRQAILDDVLAAPDLARDLYRIAGEAIEAERRAWGGGLRNMELVLRRSVGVLDGFLGSLREVRMVAERHAGSVRSPGLVAFFGRIAVELDDAWLDDAGGQVRRLRDRRLVVTASLGPGNRGVDYVLRRPADRRAGLRERAGLPPARGMSVDVTLHDQNAMNAMNALAELRSQAIVPAAAAVQESVGHILGFFRLLRAELAFYLGCANLHGELRRRGVELSWPEPGEAGERRFAARGLVDPCLALAVEAPVVGNDVDADGIGLVIVTGANGGGKSTLLRAVGIAQVMLGAGMFVAASELRAGLRSNVLTHFTREEQAGPDAGRLDAELGRLAALVAVATPASLILLNESLSTTNERDGAGIAHDVVTGLVDAGTSIWFVTHLYELARRLEEDATPGVRFLRAERGDGGERPFWLVEASPLPTSFGMDGWRRLRPSG